MKTPLIEPLEARIAPAVFSIQPTASIEEGDAGTKTLTFTVSVTDLKPSDGTVSVTVNTADGTAKTSDNDYVAIAGQVLTFSPGGPTQKTVSVTIRGDTKYELDETFTVLLSQPTGGAKISPTGGVSTATIVNNDAQPTVSISDAFVLEGNSGTTNAVFNVTLSAVSGVDVTVQVASVAGTATPGEDYTELAPMTVTIPAGQLSAQVLVPVIGDTVDEASETFRVLLSDATGATILDGEGIGTIRNDDLSTTIDDQQIIEGDDGTMIAILTVSLSAVSDHVVTVQYQTGNGTATVADGDYVATSGMLTFEPGELTKTIEVTINGDGKDENDETFRVDLLGPTNAILAKPSGTVTIQNDDDAPTVSIVQDPEGISVVEGDGGTKNLVFTIRLSAASGKTVTVEALTVNGSAIAGEDYEALAPMTVTFQPGQTERTVSVQIIGDTVEEGNEIFELQIRNAVNAVLGVESVEGVIADDDIQVNVASASVLETNEGTTKIVFEVTLSRASSEEIRVNLTTADGNDEDPAKNARAGDQDYISKSETLIFEPGETSKMVEIEVRGDTKLELDEIFRVLLSNPVNAKIGTGEALGTITNDDEAPSLTIEDVSITEGNIGTSLARFKVRLSNPTGETVTVDFATVAGTATAGSDYTPLEGTLTFNPGEVEKEIAVQIIGDVFFEADETFFVQLSNATGGVQIGTPQATGTIVNNDVQPTLSVNDVSRVEGASGQSMMVFTVTLTGVSALPVTVDVRTAENSALEGIDYLPVNMTLEFAANGPATQTKQVSVPIIGDTVDEIDEVFFLNLLNATNAQIGDGQGQGRILNDDIQIRIFNDPQPTSPAVTEIDEPTSGTTQVAFKVVLSAAPVGHDVTVTFQTVDQTATAASGDYVMKTETLVFSPGETEKIVYVEVNGDDLNEVNETFLGTITNAQNAQIVTSSASVTIIDDDEAPTISISDATVEEGDTGTTTATFTVTLSAASGRQVTVSYALRNGTATAGDDGLSPVNGTVTFAPGETSKTITISVSGDERNEADENFFIDLANPTGGATIADGTGEGTIIDNDPMPSLKIDDVTIVEGNNGTKNAVFTVTLSAVSGQTVSVKLNTVDGTAIAGEDYTGISDMVLTFEPGQTTKTVSIPIIGDLEDEADEEFTVVLSDAVNAMIETGDPEEDGIGIGKIRNDDVRISIGDASVVEGDNGTVLLSFVATLSQPSANPISVRYTTENGTATSGSDYVAADDVLTFNPGETTAVITIVVNSDELGEMSETLFVQLSDPENAILGVKSRGTGTIINDDTTVWINDVTVLEGGVGGTVTAVFTVTLDAAPGSGDVHVNFQTVDLVPGASSQNSQDYVSTNGTLVFTAQEIADGILTKTIEVAVKGDVEDEPNEDFLVRLTNARVVDGGNETPLTIADNEGRGTILDDDGNTFSISDVTVVEGDAGTKEAIFVVSLLNAPSGTATVQFNFSAGSATLSGPGADVDISKFSTVESRTLTFSGNTTTQVIRVPIVGDVTHEGDETFFVTLSQPNSGSTIAKAVGVGTIQDNDPIPTVSIDDVRIVEGDGGTRNAIFTVVLSSPTIVPVTLNYATQDGTATISDGDYEARSGSLTILPGETYQTIIVPIIGDTVNEQDETFSVVLSDIINAAPGDTTGMGTILNDEFTIGFENTNVQVVEGDDGTTEIVFKVRLNPAAGTHDHQIRVKYATSDGTATSSGSDIDYVGKSGELVFEPNEFEKEIRITVNGDELDELDETFFVTLSDPVGAVIGEGLATGTIQDNDQAVLTIEDAQLTEPNSGTGTMTFTVTLSKKADRVVTVKVSTSDGTAVSSGSGADFTPLNGAQLTFAPGETSKTFTVTVTGDAVDESDETFTVTLSDAMIGDADFPTDGSDLEAIGTILDNDGPVISISDAFAIEGGQLVYIVSLSNASPDVVEVNYAISGGTATAGLDYVSIPAGVLTFLPERPDPDNPGQILPAETSKVIVIDVLEDEVNELDETVLVKLSNPVQGSISTADGEGVGRIAYTGSTFKLEVVGSASVVEDFEGQTDSQFQTVKVRITREGNLSNAASVVLRTVDGTAVSSGPRIDYNSLTRTVQFAAGEAVAEFEVQIRKDAHYEFDETFNVRLENAINAAIKEGDNFVASTEETITILNNDERPTLSIADATVTESEGTQTMQFVVTLSAANEREETYVFASTENFIGVINAARSVAEGAFGADYNPVSGQKLTFVRGDVSEVFSVTINGDSHDEEDTEIFQAILSGAQVDEDPDDDVDPIDVDIIADGQATGTIRDNDPTPTLSVADITVTEGDSGTTAANFALKLSAASEREVTVVVNLISGTATYGSDFTGPEQQTVTFAPGETEKIITFDVIGDVRDEANETFSIQLSNPVNAVVNDGGATATIIDNDAQPSLTINSLSVVEGDSGTQFMVFTVTLNGETQNVVRVNFATADSPATGPGDATAPASSTGPLVDYGSVSGTLVFAPGETTKTISVPIYGDLFYEKNETFLVNLSNAENATIAVATGTGTILHDGDSTIGLFVRDAQVVEGDVGTKAMGFVVELTGPAPEAVTFKSSTRNGTAIAGSDFVGFTGQSGSIPAGSMTGTINVSINGDLNPENMQSENFTLEISDVSSNVTVIDGTANGLILNDDVAGAGTREFKFVDIDGDIVTIKVSKGSLTNFGLGPILQFGAVNQTTGGRQLELVNFSANPGMFRGVNMSIIAEPQLLPGTTGEVMGNGRVDVGFIQAAIVDELTLRFERGLDLGSITIDGDLGKITAGDTFVTPSIRKLSVGSLGAKGTATGAPDNVSLFLSKVTRVDVEEDLVGRLQVIGAEYGDIGVLNIGGALRGDTAIGMGQIVLTGTLGKATIGSIIGGNNGTTGGIFGVGTSNASINTLIVKGDIQGGVGADSGKVEVSRIGKLHVGGSIIGGDGKRSGFVFSSTTIKTVIVDGDILGGTRVNSPDAANPNELLISGGVAADAGIGKVTVGGSVKGRVQQDGGVIASGGSISNLTILGNLEGGSGTRSGTVQVSGVLGKFTIGVPTKVSDPVNGNVIGGTGASSGGFQVGSNIGKGIIHGNLVGGSADSTGGFDVGGAINRLEVRGDIIGGSSLAASPDGAANSVTNSGFIAAARIARMIVGGSIQSGVNNGNGLAGSGSIRVAGDIGRLDIGEGVFGTAETPVVISAGGVFNDTAFKSVRIAGSAQYLNLLGGYNPALNIANPLGTPVNGDAQIGTVQINGSVEGVNIVAGARPGADGRFGTSDDVVISGSGTINKQNVISKIAKVIIGNTVVAAEDSYGIVAQHIAAITASPSPSLVKGPGNDRPNGVVIGGVETFRAFELAV